MIVVERYSTSAVWRPDAETNDTVDGVPAKKKAGPCQVSYLKLSAGGGAAVVEVYNAASTSDMTPANLVWFLDASTTDNDVNPFPSSLNFNRGVCFKLVQGTGQNPVVSFSTVLSP